MIINQLNIAKAIKKGTTAIVPVKSGSEASLESEVMSNVS